MQRLRVSSEFGERAWHHVWQRIRRGSIRQQWLTKVRTTRALWLVLLIALGCPLLGSVGTIATYAHYASEYQNDKALAEAGLAKLKAGEAAIQNLLQSPTSATDLQAAQTDFAAAEADFTAVNSDLQGLPTLATAVPKYGSLVAGARKLAPVAIEAARLGLLGCDAIGTLQPLLISPLGDKSKSKTPVLTLADVTHIRQDLTQMRGFLNALASQVDDLQPADLAIDPSAASELGTLRAELPSVQQGLNNLIALTSAAPTLLGIGSPASYLIEQLDSTELRPGGGFIGTYGMLTISGGRIATFDMTDVDLLDGPFEAAGGYIPFPSQYRWFPLVSNWSLRDSNLDADFPTDARSAEQNYHLEGGTTPLQGVIAVTPWLIKDAMAITGPISVPEYGRVVTASNLIDTIHYYQLNPASGSGSDQIASPDGHSSLRKRFTSYLFAHFMDRIRALMPTHGSEFVHLLLNGLKTKDIQVYFNQTTAENVLRQYNVASTIAAPQGDSLFVVDANIIANKANDFMSYTLNDQITIDNVGNVTHHTTLAYTWPVSAESSQNDYGTTWLYRDYLRLYVPPGSQLQAQTGWTFQGTSQAFGREVFAGVLTMPYGGSVTITLTWTTPHAAHATAQGWQYTYLVQRPAGVFWQYRVHVTLPSCAQGISSTFPSVKGTQLSMPATPLDQDTQYSATYTCKH